MKVKENAKVYTFPATGLQQIFLLYILNAGTEFP